MECKSAGEIEVNLTGPFTVYFTKETLMPVYVHHETLPLEVDFLAATFENVRLLKTTGFQLQLHF